MLRKPKAKSDPTLSVDSVNRPIPDTRISPTENFDFGEALVLVHPLLEIIFEFLPADDLIACSKVSALWSPTARYLLEKRRSPSWFTCYKNSTKDKILHSPNLHYGNAGIGIVFYNSCHLKINDWVKLNANSQEIPITVSNYFTYELISKKVDYCMLSVHRTISYFSKERSPEEIERRGSIFDGIVIPKIPSVRTVMFEFISRKLPQSAKFINSLVRPEEETKCLLIFSRNTLNIHWNFLLCRLVQNSNSVAIGGGIIKAVKTVQNKAQNRPVQQTVCLAFLKDKTSDLNNFNAYSCCIEDPDLGSEEFVLKLRNFRKNMDLKCHSLAFRIACVSKFTGWMELRLFEEVFPNVPLASIDARGEFGWDSFPGASAPEKDANQLHVLLEHQYSSVFVIITWD